MEQKDLVLSPVCYFRAYIRDKMDSVPLVAKGTKSTLILTYVRKDQSGVRLRR